MKMLKNDGFLKILSLAIAIGLWFYVVQVHNPDMEKTFRGIPVVFAQKSTLEDKGLILLNDKDITIDVEVRGNRKNMMNLSSSDITVVADISTIEDKGAHNVVTTVMLPYGNLEVVNKKPSTFTVEVDDLVTETFDIKVLTIGSPQEGYAVDTTEAIPEKIQVTGAKTILGGIESVLAEINVTDKFSDVTTVASPKIFDSNGKEISTSHVKFDKDNINVRCKILKTKSVQIKPVISGNLAVDGDIYQLDRDSIPSINIKGPANIISGITHVKTIPITVFDIDDSGDAKITLDLPEGVTSVDGDYFTIRFTRMPANNSN